MLRSPLSLLGEHRWSAAAVVLCLGAALWILAALVTAGLQTRAAVEGWWELYTPAVYLEADVTETAMGALKTELEGWPQVRSVALEDREAAMTRLVEEIGAEEVEALGITTDLMPAVLLVEPVLWYPGEAETLSRLQALEVRPEVVTVDVPSPQAVAWVNRGRAVVLGPAVIALLLWIGALGGLAVFLRRLQESERRENHLLEVFGASAMALRRPTIWRGAVLGFCAGAVAGGLFLPWSLSLDTFVAGFAAEGAMSAVSSALISAALPVIGLSCGTLVGWAGARPRQVSEVPRMKGLLGWERE